MVNGNPGEEAAIAAIQQLIKTSFISREELCLQALNENPVEQPSNDALLQNLDINLRKCISTHVKAAKFAGEKPENLKKMAKKLNDLRRSYLKKYAQHDSLHPEVIENCAQNFAKLFSELLCES